MQPRDIQAEISIIQTELRAIKADPTDVVQRADTMERALEALRAKCERIRDSAALPLGTSAPLLPSRPAADAVETPEPLLPGA